MPRPIIIDKFKGLDLNPQAQRDPGLLAQADNVEVMPSRALRRRPALRYYGTLDSTSRGLYRVGNSIRAALPYQSPLPTGLPHVTYDVLNTASGMASNHIAAVTGVETDALGQPYIAIRTVAGPYEHHYVRGLAGVDTQISPGFAPGPALRKIGERMWASAQSDPLLHGSAIDQFDTWSPSGSPAGVFRNTGQYANQGTSIKAITAWNGQIVVFYNDSIQLWTPGPADDDIGLIQAIRGAGLAHRHSYAEVSPDLFYAGQSDFRSLSSIIVAGQGVFQGAEARETDFGARLRPQTSQDWQTEDEVLATYAARRGQYLAAWSVPNSSPVQTYIWCLSVNRDRKVLDWTRWVLPPGIRVDAMTEFDSWIWLRSGNDVYRFSETEHADLMAGGTEYPIECVLDVGYLLGKTTNYKMLNTLGILATDDMQAEVYLDGRLYGKQYLPGNYPEINPILLGGMGRNLRLVFRDATVRAPWTLEAVAVEMSGGN